MLALCQCKANEKTTYTLIGEGEIMKIVGFLLIGLGALDVGLSYIGIDIYWEIGIYVPDWLYEWTGFIPMTIGVLLLLTGTHKGKVAEFKGSLNKGETLVKSGNASIRESWTKTENGVLLLTDTRLFFHGISKTSGQNMSYEDVGSYDFELLLGDISSVETKFPTYIIIKNKDNNEFKLMVSGKEKWKNEILKN
jgi:hypothetical protein